MFDMFLWLFLAAVTAFILMAVHVKSAAWGPQACLAALFVLAFGVFLIELVKESR